MTRRIYTRGSKTIALTDAMIARRDGIARALGRELLDGPKGQFWSRGEFNRCVRFHTFGHGPGVHEYMWPEDAEKAAWAIDKGKPLPHDPPDVAPATAAPNANQMSLFGGAR